MSPRPAPASAPLLRPSLATDLELLTEILRVARTFFGVLADDLTIAGLVAGYAVSAAGLQPVEVTAALVRQLLGLTRRGARVIVPAGRATIFDSGLWTVSFVDAVTAARGGGPGLVLYFAPTRTGWQIIPGELHGPRVTRRISFPTGWPEAMPVRSA